jgi:hypothetical protein
VRRTFVPNYSSPSPLHSWPTDVEFVFDSLNLSRRRAPLRQPANSSCHASKISAMRSSTQ